MHVYYCLRNLPEISGTEICGSESLMFVGMCTVVPEGAVISGTGWRGQSRQKFTKTAQTQTKNFLERIE